MGVGQGRARCRKEYGSKRGVEGGGVESVCVHGEGWCKGRAGVSMGRSGGASGVGETSRG